MTEDELLEALAAIGVTDTGGRLELRGSRLPGVGLNPDALDVLPSKARGDYREKTVHEIVKDGVSDPNRMPTSRLVADGFAQFEGVAEEQRERFGKVLRDHFVVTTANGTDLLFPFHTDVPGNYDFKGQYKMFNGRLLAFIARPGEGQLEVNVDLISRFYDLFNNDEGLTLLDHQVRRIARSQGAAGATAQASVLLASQGADLVAPAFPDAHRLIQRDLGTAIALASLGRRDKISAVLTVLYFHVAVHYWRAAWCVEEQVVAFIKWLDAPSRRSLQELERAHSVAPNESTFHGRIKFRVANSQGRRVSMSEPSVSAYREIDVDRLLRLPANLTFLKVIRDIGGLLSTGIGPTTNLQKVADLLSNESREALDVAARGIAWSAAQEAPDEARRDIVRRALVESTGVSALRGTIESVNRRNLRRLGRDVTAQVMKRGGKGIVATRGNLTYFELGPELLVLLTKLVASDGRIPFREFIRRIGEYGLAPQDRDEVERLAAVMRSMQLLEKHSDAGEAMYVSHFL